MALETTVTADPPPLPSVHITRASVFSSLAREFDSHSVVAVVGYPESGKTIAVAEFATEYQGTVFWFTVPSSEANPEAWYLLFCYALAQFLGSPSFAPTDLRSSLLSRKLPTLIVIDDAQYCHSLDILSFVFQGADSSPSVWLLLLGVDAPQFRTAVRQRALPEWRIPGLAANETESLFEQLGGELTPEQLTALEALRIRTDGHLGMLRLSHATIRAIATSENASTFIENLEIGLGASLEALQGGMTERLRASLDAMAVELCRRLSVAIRPFNRNTGLSVAELDPPIEEFPAHWNKCALGVFEHQPRSRYALPDIYRHAFGSELSTQATKALHRCIADGLVNESGARNVFDVEAHVTHLLLAGDKVEALNAATYYLALAEGPAEKAVKLFFINRFSTLLNDVVNDDSIALDGRIRWFAIATRIFSELHLRTDELDAASQLERLLALDVEPIDRHTLQLGWAVVLMHASRHGIPRKAMEAASHLEDDELEGSGIPPLRFREYLILTSFLNGKSNPLDHLKSLLRKADSQVESQYWDELLGYDLWRSVALCIFNDIANKNAIDPPAARRACDVVGSLVTLANENSEPEVGVILGALMVSLQIDILRVPGDSRSTAERIKSAYTLGDAKISAYVHDTLGDALRCDGAFVDAEVQYEIALQLWPEDVEYDRAESYLMRAICQARLGDFEQAARNAQLAAKSHLKNESHAELSVARCYLEAAAMYVHGSKHPRAVYFLRRAHDVLMKHRNGPEWPALGQIAWAVVNKISPESGGPEPPVPGFSLGLRDLGGDAEGMVPTAPTLMLARAYSAIGSPYRAIKMFEEILSECNSDELKTQVATLSLESALEISDISLSARYGAYASEWLSQAPANSPPGLYSYVVDYQLGRVVRIASADPNEAEALGNLEKAIEAIDSTGVRNSQIELVRKTYEAYFHSREVGVDTKLDEVFRQAIESNAMWIAREIAWYWCYRFAVSKLVYESQFIQWHFRLSWLNLQIAPTDTYFIRGCLAQEIQVLDKLDESAISAPLKKLRQTLSPNDCTPLEATKAFAIELANISSKFGNIGEICDEVSYALQRCSDREWLARPLDSLCTRLLDLIIHPGAHEAIEELVNEIDRVNGLLDDCEQTSLAEARENLQLVRSLAESIRSGQATEAGFVSMVKLRDRIYQLSANSAAQCYVMLRHSSEIGRRDIFSLEDTCRLLLTPHVDALLGDGQLFEYMRIRLATCQLCARNLDAHRRLLRAIMIVETQKKLHSPIARQAIEDAAASKSSVIAEIVANNAELDRIEQLAAAQGLRQEVWSCSMERGGTRKMTGATLLIQCGDTGAEDIWLRPSLADFRIAVTAAGSVTSTTSAALVLKPAMAGLTVAKRLNDEAAIEEFGNVIESIRSLGLYEAQLAEQESFELHDPLQSGPTSDAHKPFLKPEDEKGIQEYVDLIMSSTGFGPDRREFVEDDVRKIAQIEDLQRCYCEYLQPLQNLSHLSHPATAYTFRTMYVAACSLLGYELSIEVDDLESTVAAMKSVHCDTCPHRHPRDDFAAEEHS
ncbi:hypothetical protein [Aeoliella sp. SH292]|uniref:hypothetical protein n=1 Tax=Aeoliella sp. SH292 TaxID=3454464 RepID=UPI003F99DC91